MLNFVATGEQNMEKLVNEALDKHGKKSFYTTISRSGILTFSDFEENNMANATNIPLFFKEEVTLILNKLNRGVCTIIAMKNL